MADSKRLKGLVFDDIDTRLAIEVMLDQHGFDIVAEARTAGVAIEHAARTAPDLVVVDLALSGGLGIVPRLLAVAPTAVIVVLSPFTALHERALEAGARELLDKYDLRPLRPLLHALRFSPAAAGCTCRFTVHSLNSGAAFDPLSSTVAVPTFRRPPVPPVPPESPAG